MVYNGMAKIHIIQAILSMILILLSFLFVCIKQVYASVYLNLDTGSLVIFWPHISLIAKIGPVQSSGIGEEISKLCEFLIYSDFLLLLSLCFVDFTEGDVTIFFCIFWKSGYTQGTQLLYIAFGTYPC